MKPTCCPPEEDRYSDLSDEPCPDHLPPYDLPKGTFGTRNFIQEGGFGSVYKQTITRAVDNKVFAYAVKDCLVEKPKAVMSLDGFEQVIGKALALQNELNASSNVVSHGCVRTIFFKYFPSLPEETIDNMNELIRIGDTSKASSRNQARSAELRDDIGGVLLDLGEGFRVVLYMEHFDGPNLWQVCNDSEYEPTAEEFLSIVSRSLFALGELHEMKLVHKDIKLQNLLFRKAKAEDCADIVKICDLASLQPENYSPQQNLQTLLFVPPELDRRMVSMDPMTESRPTCTSITGSVDIYGLGTVFAILGVDESILSLMPDFKESPKQQFAKTYALINNLRPELEGFRDLLMAMTSFEASARPDIKSLISGNSEYAVLNGVNWDKLREEYDTEAQRVAEVYEIPYIGKPYGECFLARFRQDREQAPFIACFGC